jgi:hypothetical protein
MVRLDKNIKIEPVFQCIKVISTSDLHPVTDNRLNLEMEVPTLKSVNRNTISMRLLSNKSDILTKLHDINCG